MPWKSSIVMPVLSKLAPLFLKIKGCNQCIRILAYHRILDPGVDFKYDTGVISASPEMFERQIQFLRKHFTFITFKDLKESIGKNKALPPNPLIITFDDGYRDNYTDAFPILKKHNVPATVFLTADYIGNGKLFWWDLIAYAVKTTKKTTLQLTDGAAVIKVNFNDCSEQENAIKQILKFLKNVSDDQRDKMISNIIKDLNVSINDRQGELQALNWDEVRAMKKDGMEFGSHTSTHPILSKITDAAKVRHELQQSKKIIEQNIDEPVIAFSYPVGRKDGISDSVLREVENAGYDFAVTYIHGINGYSNNLNRFFLKRLDIDGVSLDRFRAKVCCPGLFSR